MRVQLKLSTVGTAAGPLYDGYYSTNGTTYTLASDGSNLSLPTTESQVSITVPDNATQIKLVNKSEGCNNNSFIVPVVTTTTTTTSTPMEIQISIPCVTNCSTNGTLTITSITGGAGPPYQTALIDYGRSTVIWNNYPEITTYGNLQASCSSSLATGRLGVRSTSNNYTVWYQTTLCTTTTQAPVAVRIDPLDGLPTSNYTLYVNGVASDYKSGIAGTLVPAGSQVSLVYNSNCCGVEYHTGNDNWTPYVSGTVVSAPRWWRLRNVNAWTFVSYQCIGNFYYENQVNPCGQTQQVRVYPESTCDCICNENCSGTYYGPNVCGGAVGLPNDLIQYQYYSCNNNSTGSYQLIQNCSCSCNQACNGTYQGQPYCSGNERRVDNYWSCNNAYESTTIISACSCDCNQACSGEYWGDPYCDGTGIQKRNRKYVCNNADTGQVETISTCSQACGAFVAPIWTPVGDPYCDGCYQKQDEVQSNVCCPDPAQGSPRTVELGISNDCGSWNLEYYCVVYDKWSRLRNSCTNDTCCDTLVEVNSAYCGYVPPPACRTYQIVGDYTDESVTGIYTNCSGGSDSFSFFGGPGTVGYICALAGSVYVTSGNGSANDVGGC